MSVIAGCATKIPDKIDPSLPAPKNIKTISSSAAIGFEWASEGDDTRLMGFAIYRQNKQGKFELVGRADDRYATHFVDDDLNPNEQYSYEIKSFSTTALSKPSQSIKAHTRPLLTPLPFVQVLWGLPQRVKLIWRPHPDSSVQGYEIYRSENGQDFKFLSSVKNRLSAEYIDKDVQPGKKYFYIIYAKNAEGLSQPSQIQKATTKPLPKPISQLNASRDGAKKIVLSWDSEAFDDFSHFNIYRASSKILPYTLVASPKTNTYVDLENENNATRYYEISVVDKDGLESKRVGVMGRTLAAPNAPRTLSLNANGTSVNLSWQAEARAVKYLIYKKEGSNEILLATTNKSNYTDSDLLPLKDYTYSVVAVDKFGLESARSNKVKYRYDAQF